MIDVTKRHKVTTSLVRNRGFIKRTDRSPGSPGIDGARTPQSPETGNGQGIGREIGTGTGSEPGKKGRKMQAARDSRGRVGFEACAVSRSGRTQPLHADYEFDITPLFVSFDTKSRKTRENTAF
ncbi:MAG: hypothetical protein JW902_16940 [Syntrophaceae bacterium]|nr:hypothetical protein [Syntrophaceae bacterium]